MKEPLLKIIGLSGRMHSGKTTAAQYLIDNHGYRRESFAGPLKQDVLDCGFTQQHIDDKPPWMRSLMQSYGQARRAVDPDHWVKIMRDILVEDVGKIVIDDIRFPNEADMLAALDEHPEISVLLIRIGRNNYDYSNVPGADDESEHALRDYPFLHSVWVENTQELEAGVRAYVHAGRMY